MQSFLNKRRVAVSVSLSGAGKYNTLFITLHDKAFENKAFKLLREKFDYQKRQYAENIVHVFNKDEKEHLAFCIHKGLLLISDKRTLVEESIRQIDSDFNLKNDPDFARLNQTANPKDLASVYIRLNELPNWLKTQLPQTTTSYISKMGKWMELDLQVYNRELLLNGITLANEEEGHYLSTFKDISSQKNTVDRFLPENIGLWISHTFRNPEHYYRNYEKYLEQNGKLTKHQKLLASLNIDTKDKLLSWMESEMGLIYTGVNPEGLAKMAYFKTKDSEKATEKLESISDSSYIEGYRGMIIKQLGPTNLLPRFYGNLFTDFNKPYYFIANGFVWFGESEATVKGYINDLITGKSLAANTSYQNLKAKILPESHISVLASNSVFFDLALSHFSNKQKKKLEATKEELKNFRWASLQFEMKKDVAFTNFMMLNEQKVEEVVSRQWSTLLDAPAIGAPQMVLNHNNKKYEILIQDENHTIYLINRNGKILWKRNLDASILGKATQVDLFKNNKLQMVFNTASSLYVVDRLGRDVENFPVKLEEPASAPVAVLNYDRARNYRFILPVGDQLLNYKKDGKKVRGWAFKKADDIISSQPQLFTVFGKDIISCMSDAGTLYLLNRKGEDRYEQIKEIGDVIPPFYLRSGEDVKTSELIAKNEEGELVVVSIGGTVDKIDLDEDHQIDQLVYFQDSYVFSDGDMVLVKNENQPWKYDLEAEVRTLPKPMIFDGALYVAAFSEESESIYLLNQEGNLVNGFPVFGQGDFAMGSLKQNKVLNVITTSKDGTVICYELD